MRYLNQLDFEHIEYPTTLEKDGELSEPFPSIAKAGCGIICTCMLVDGMTNCSLSVRDCVKCAQEAGANRFGTDMMRLAPAIANRYDLKLKFSDDINDLSNCLNYDGMAILHTGKVKGVFSDSGHYVLATNIHNNKIHILDPSYTQEKYAGLQNKRYISIEYPYIIVSKHIVIEQTQSRSPSYYLFYN
jgi:hypothetical protein